MDEIDLRLSNVALSGGDNGGKLPEFDGVAGDVVIQSGKDSLKAHKIVLKSCPYFSAVIEGNWLESQHLEPTIALKGYSCKSVRLVVEHLYKPKCDIGPDNDLIELVVLADMLGLDSLTSVVCDTVTTRLCHSFHKPCAECIAGVTLTIQLACTYNLIDIKTKCLKWLTKHFIKVWNSRCYAALGDEIHNTCLNEIKLSMNTNNLIDLALECQVLADTLPTVKWAEPVAALVRNLSVTCTNFLQENFETVLKSNKFQSLEDGNSWDVSLVESVLLQAVPDLPVKQCCLSYVALADMLIRLENCADRETDANFLSFVRNLHKQVETRLVHRVPMATKCSAWNTLSKPVQATILQLGQFSPLMEIDGVDNKRKNPAPTPQTRTLTNRVQRSNSEASSHRPTSSGIAVQTRVNPSVDPWRSSAAAQPGSLMRPRQSSMRAGNVRNVRQPVDDQVALRTGRSSAPARSSPRPAPPVSSTSTNSAQERNHSRTLNDAPSNPSRSAGQCMRGGSNRTRNNLI